MAKRKPQEGSKERNKPQTRSVGRKNPDQGGDVIADAIRMTLHSAHKIEPKTSAYPGQRQYGDKLRNLTASVRRWFVSGERIFAAALAIFALAEVIVGSLQWDAMRRQTTLAQNQLEQFKSVTMLDQRAWLNIQVPIFDEFGVGKPFEGNIAIRNTGKTPAVILNEYGILFIRPTPEFIKTMQPDEVPNHLDDDISKMILEFVHAPDPTALGYVVGPGDTNTYVQERDDNERPITQETFDQIVAGNKVPAFFKAFKYRDIFGDTHMSWSFFVYRIKSRTWERHPDYDHMD